MISPTKKSAKEAEKREFLDRLLPEKISTAPALLSPRKPFRGGQKDNGTHTKTYPLDDRALQHPTEI